MRTLFILFLGIIVSVNGISQEEKIKEFVNEGTQFHDFTCSGDFNR